MVSDSTVDSIRFYWNRTDTGGPWTGNGPRIISCPYELRLLEDILTLRYWEIHLKLLGALVAARLLQSENEKSQNFKGLPFARVLFHTEENSGEMVFSDQFDEVSISEGAFERLMDRYFDTVLSGVPLYRKKWLDHNMNWWPEFRKAAAMLKEKLNLQNRRGVRPQDKSSSLFESPEVLAV